MLRHTVVKHLLVDLREKTFLQLLFEISRRHLGRGLANSSRRVNAAGFRIGLPLYEGHLGTLIDVNKKLYPQEDQALVVGRDIRLLRDLCLELVDAGRRVHIERKFVALIQEICRNYVDLDGHLDLLLLDLLLWSLDVLLLDLPLWSLDLQHAWILMSLCVCRDSEPRVE